MEPFWRFWDCLLFWRYHGECQCLRSLPWPRGEGLGQREMEWSGLGSDASNFWGEVTQWEGSKLDREVLGSMGLRAPPLLSVGFSSPIYKMHVIALNCLVKIKCIHIPAGKALFWGNYKMLWGAFLLWPENIMPLNLTDNREAHFKRRGMGHQNHHKSFGLANFFELLFCTSPCSPNVECYSFMIYSRTWWIWLQTDTDKITWFK